MSTRTIYCDATDPATSCMLCNGYLEPMGCSGSHLWYRCRNCGDVSSTQIVDDPILDDVESDSYVEDG